MWIKPKEHYTQITNICLSFHCNTVMEVLNEGVKVGLLDHVMSLWRAMRLHVIREGKKTQVKLDILKFE